jgi:GntR family transcriptional regulator, rspAB operon transcriptional repressor
MDTSAPALLRFRDRSRHAAPQVFEFLKERIVSLELKPGTVLSRTELQESFRLSSTPIRDALLKLQQEDLVEIFPQHATVVSPIDLAHARHAHFLRRSIELEVVRTLALAPESDIVRRLRDLIDEQKRLARINDLARFNSLDLDFHRTLCEGGGVPDLWNLVRRHSGHLDRLRRLHLPVRGKAKQILDDHAAIVDAIAAGQPEQAQDHVRDHLSKSLAFSGEMRARFPDYFRN